MLTSWTAKFGAGGGHSNTGSSALRAKAGSLTARMWPPRDLPRSGGHRARSAPPMPMLHKAASHHALHFGVAVSTALRFVLGLFWPDILLFAAYYLACSSRRSFAAFRPPSGN
jgi:hypothetical protein